MSEWQPLNTAPVGEIFLATDDAGIGAIVMIEETPDRTVESRDWLFRRQVKTIKGESRLYLAIPWKGGYSPMGIRSDTNWWPTRWRSVKDI